MMKCTEKLVLGHATNVGNHSESYDEVSTIEKFFYHGNCVCEVNHSKRTFKLDDCGYGGCNSTIRTLNDYRKHFIGVGYTEIFPEMYLLKDYLANMCEGKMHRCFYKDTTTQITTLKRLLGNEKFCRVEIAIETMEHCLTYEFHYKGIKTFCKAFNEKMEQFKSLNL